MSAGRVGSGYFYYYYPASEKPLSSTAGGFGH